jgi:hypothetical protein
MLILRRIPFWAVMGLLVYMPFHIFLAQSVSLLTGGLDVWKVAKDVVLALVCLFTICLVWQQRKGTRVFNLLVGLGALYLVFHLLLWLFNRDIHATSAILGTVYNARLPAFLVLGYGATLLYPSKFAFSSVVKLVLIVGAIVAVLGILQFFLPKDILSHFGYGLDRGARPTFFIDDNQAFPRSMSTLREPNALGAYLVVPLTAAWILLLRSRQLRERATYAGLGVLYGVTIFLTFSRSAWLGAALALILAGWWTLSTQIVRLAKQWWPAVMVVLSLFVIIGLAQQNNQFVKTYITHSTPEAVEDLDSNDYHWLLTRQGLEGVVDNPAGHGPGTAGIVSIQNPKGAFLTENYYVQIAYEVGLLGLAVFVAISVVVYVGLYRRHDTVGSLLLVAFWAYVLTNMLLHTWSNEAVAAQWWILAGLALLPRERHPQ